MMKRVTTWAIVLLMLLGCSATERTSRNATDIANLAKSSETRFDAIGSEARSENPDLNSIQTNASAGVKEQKEIQTKTEIIHADVPRMNDKVPWWASLLNNLFLVGGLIALLALLIFTPLGRGLSSLVGNALSLVASFLPTPSTKKGILLAKMDDPNDPMTKEQAVSAIRAMDPVAEKSYLRTRKKLKLKAQDITCQSSPSPASSPATSSAISSPS